MLIGVLAPRIRRDPGHPADWPIGRAALALEREGVGVMIGDRAEEGGLVGVRATAHGWRETTGRVVGVYDRFPSRSRAADHRTLRSALDAEVWVNAPPIVELCADKVACQRWLEAVVPMPEIETDPDRFAARLATWRAAFAKPRFGAFGAGVERVTVGMTVTAERESSVPGVAEPTILQRAVPPPAGFAGVAVRVLVQREATGGWWVGPAVVRHHRTDPVVNAARGAAVSDARGLLFLDEPDLQQIAETTAHRLAEAPAGDRLVEIGVDIVIDEARRPFVIEVNSRPRGRLEVLAQGDPDRYRALHLAACARPLRWLAGQSPTPHTR